MEYASRGVGNTGLGLGIAGTALGVLNGAGGIASLLGVAPRASQPADPGDRPVTRYEMSLYQEIGAKNDELVQMRAEKYADAKADILQSQVNQTSVWIAGATANMGFMNEQIQKIAGMTKLVIPDTNVVTIKTAAISAPASSTDSNG